MQIETSLSAATTGSGAVAGRPAPTLLIQQALEAIARISKGFNANLCTRVRPEIGKLLLSIGLDVCMALDATQQLRFQDSSCTPDRNNLWCSQVHLYLLQLPRRYPKSDVQTSILISCHALSPVHPCEFGRSLSKNLQSCHGFNRDVKVCSCLLETLSTRNGLHG